MLGRGRRSPATVIALVYLAFSVGWILLSDQALQTLSLDPARSTQIQSLKGVVFVAASALVIFLVSRRYLDRAGAAAAELQLAYDATLNGWASALDLRDHSTAEHTHRVTELTVELAARFGFAGEALEDVRRGATLHDIGKMGVPDDILGKPGALTDDEWRQMRRHPDLAVDMLRGIDYLVPALPIPWCHHEKWDGSGYPRGLAGLQIPLEARLFAVVDVYDAVTSDRPYRRPMTDAEALALISAGSGSHFDPQVVPVFLELVTGTAQRPSTSDAPAPQLS
jgi:HD-GYP domain-containing protein (c-di-GMP phosphodiesterase class II)